MGCKVHGGVPLQRSIGKSRWSRGKEDGRFTDEKEERLAGKTEIGGAKWRQGCWK